MASASAAWQPPIAPRAAIRPLGAAASCSNANGWRRADVGDAGTSTCIIRRLQLGDFGKRGVDAVFDRADLGGDFISGIFDHLFAHDCSFPGVEHAGVAVGLI